MQHIQSVCQQLPDACSWSLHELSMALLSPEAIHPKLAARRALAQCHYWFRLKLMIALQHDSLYKKKRIEVRVIWMFVVLTESAVDHFSMFC